MKEIIILLSVLCIVLFVAILGIAKLFVAREKWHQKNLSKEKYALCLKHQDELVSQRYVFQDKLNLLKRETKVSLIVPGTDIPLFRIPILEPSRLIDYRQNPLEPVRHKEITFEAKRYMFDSPMRCFKKFTEGDVLRFAADAVAEELIKKDLLSYKIINTPYGPEISCGFYLFEKR